jgi:hypothetical protein
MHFGLDQSAHHDDIRIGGCRLFSLLALGSVPSNASIHTSISTRGRKLWRDETKSRTETATIDSVSCESRLDDFLLTCSACIETYRPPQFPFHDTGTLHFFELTYIRQQSTKLSRSISIRFLPPASLSFRFFNPFLARLVLTRWSAKDQAWYRIHNKEPKSS